MNRREVITLIGGEEVKRSDSVRTNRLLAAGWCAADPVCCGKSRRAVRAVRRGAQRCAHDIIAYPAVDPAVCLRRPGGG
jgi:hypothetical protein